MGQGGYIFCELDSIQKSYPRFQQALAALETKAVLSCANDWFPKLSPETVFAKLKSQDDPFGRTTILPACFDDHSSNPILSASWRQLYTVAGHQMILQGVGSGETLPENMKIAWYGLAFPNKEQHITEIKWQLSDRKYGRINLEEMHLYNKPAVVFEEGMILDEEEAFHLYANIKGPIPTAHDGNVGQYQSAVMLGALYYDKIDKVLGATGAAIP